MYGQTTTPISCTVDSLSADAEVHDGGGEGPGDEALRDTMLQTMRPHAVLDGRYELLDLIGEGGHGMVFRGIQRSTGQEVAVKVMRPGLLDANDAPITIARFEREMRLIARLKHPHIVRLVDTGRLADGSLYTVLDFIEGQPLSRVIDTQGPLPIAVATRIMGQVLDALACAHRMGVVHRDLKPENIMLTRTGARLNATVLDFGIAALVEDARAPDYRSLTSDGQINGTPQYMSPEQLLGDRPSPATDIYAWGLIFLECLSGTPTVIGSSLISVISQQISPTPIPIPPALSTHPLAAVLARATEKVGGNRFSDADEALAALEAASSAAHAAVHQPAPARVHRPDNHPTTEPPFIEHQARDLEWSARRRVARELLSQVEGSLHRMSSQGQQVVLSRLASHAAVALARLRGEVPRAGGLERWVMVISTGITVIALAIAAVALTQPKQPAPRTTETRQPGVAEPEPDPTPRLVQTSTDPIPVDHDPPTPPRPPAGLRGQALILVEAGRVSSWPASDFAELCRRDPDGCAVADLDEVTIRPTEDVPAYFLDAAEVSNRDYGECVDAGACSDNELAGCGVLNMSGQYEHPPLDDNRRRALAIRVQAPELPATCVSYEDARDYCHWAGKRLPRPNEWELAAAGTLPQRAHFSWGEQFDSRHANAADASLSSMMQWTTPPVPTVRVSDGFAFAAPVLAFWTEGQPVQLHGNVAEWVDDNGTASTKGGSWADSPLWLSAALDRPLPAETRRTTVGFRCATDPVD